MAHGLLPGSGPLHTLRNPTLPPPRGAARSHYSSGDGQEESGYYVFLVNSAPLIRIRQRL